MTDDAKETSGVCASNVSKEAVVKQKCNANKSIRSLPLSFEIDLDPSSLEMLREKYGGGLSGNTSSAKNSCTISLKKGGQRFDDQQVQQQLCRDTGNASSPIDAVTSVEKIIHMLEAQKRAIERLEAKVDRLLLMEHNLHKNQDDAAGRAFREIHSKVTKTFQEAWIIRAIRAIYIKAQQERIMQQIDLWMFMKWMAAAAFLAIRMQSRLTVKKPVSNWDKYRIPTMFVAVIIFFCIQSGLLQFLYRIIRELPTWMQNTPPPQPITNSGNEQQQQPTSQVNHHNNEDPTVIPPPPAINRGGIFYEILYLISGFFFSLMPAWQPGRDGEVDDGVAGAQQQQLIAEEENEEDEGEGEIVDEGSTDAHAAAAAGNLQDLERIAVSQPFSLSRKDINGWTPLHEAARSGSVECVNFLVVTKGLDVNPRTAEGTTPLYEANLVHASQHPVIRLLKRLGGLDIGPSSTSTEEEDDEEEDEAEAVDDILM